MCRFHLTYPTQGASKEQKIWDDDWDLEEVFIGVQVDDAVINEENVTQQVELVKAISMMYCDRYETHCDECEPLLLPAPR